MKWAVPLLDLTLDDRMCGKQYNSGDSALWQNSTLILKVFCVFRSEEEHQVASHRLEISEQQSEIAKVQSELKQEMKKVRGTNDGNTSHVRLFIVWCLHFV